MARLSANPEASAGSQANDDRRRLRGNYRNLIRIAEEQKDELVAPNSDKLREFITKADTLHQNVCKPREQAVDSELMSQLSEYGVALAKKLNPASESHNPKDLVNRLKTVFSTGWASQIAAENPDAFDWNGLGMRVSKYFPAAPAFSCMLGPMKATVKVRSVAQRRSRMEVGELVNPELVAAGANEDRQQETDKNMQEMIKVLKAHKEGLPVPELVNNPRSFAQTVENIFALSFLVRDGLAKLTRGGERGLWAEEGQQMQVGAGAPGGITQFVLTYDIKMWEEMQAVLEPAEGYMRHREDKTANTGVGPGRGIGRAAGLTSGDAPPGGASSGAAGGGKGKGKRRMQEESEDEDDEAAPARRKSSRR